MTWEDFAPTQPVAGGSDFVTGTGIHNLFIGNWDICGPHSNRGGCLWSAFAAALLLFLLSGTFSYAGQPAPKAQEQFAPYWTSEPGWATELQLRSNLPSKPLTVTPVLRVASGREIPLDATTIPPNSSTSVWVNEGLLAHASDLLNQPGSYGSVVFRFTSPGALNLHATVVVAMQGEPASIPMSAYPERYSLSTARGNGPGSLEGILVATSRGPGRCSGGQQPFREESKRNSGTLRRGGQEVG